MFRKHNSVKECDTHELFYKALPFAGQAHESSWRLVLFVWADGSGQGGQRVDGDADDGGGLYSHPHQIPWQESLLVYAYKERGKERMLDTPCISYSTSCLIQR